MLFVSIFSTATIARAATTTDENQTIITDINNDSNVTTYSTSDDGNISFSIPTEVPCVMKANGDVLSPSKWKIENTCSKEIKLSSISVSDLNQNIQDIDIKLYEGDDNSGKRLFHFLTTESHYSDSVTITANQSISCRWWCDGIDDYIRHNVSTTEIHIANVLFSFKSNEPTQFAVYSDDDKSLKFYNRIDVPSVGNTFNGTKVTAVYTDLKSYTYIKDEGPNGTPTTPWADRRKAIQYVDIVDKINPPGISFWFQQCEAITNFRHLENIDTSKISEMNHTFFDCSNITSIDCSSWDVSNVTYFDQVFGSCQKLKTANISGWDTSKAGTFYYMFYFDIALETVKGFSNLNLSSCHSFMHNFNSCYAIENIDFSTLHLLNDARTDGTVYHCINLRSIKVDSNFKWAYGPNTNEQTQTISSPSSEYIKDADDYGYWYDSSDSKGHLPTALPQNHATTYYAVKPCFAVYSSSDESLSFYKRFDKPQEGGAIDGKTVTKVYDGIEYSDFEVIDGHNEYPFLPWLDKVDKIKTVKVIDEGIHPKAVSNWCFGMSNATSIDLTLLDTSRCTDFRSLFNGCSSIKELDLSNMDMSKMQDGRSMYMGSALYKVTISDTFRYDTTTSDSDAYYYLPIPNPDIIDGADGKWYKEDDGVAYAPQDVPKGGKGTYLASNVNFPNMTLKLFGFETNMNGGELTFKNIPFKNFDVSYRTYIKGDSLVTLQSAELTNLSNSSDINLLNYGGTFGAVAINSSVGKTLYGEAIIHDKETDSEIMISTKKVIINNDDATNAHYAFAYDNGGEFLTLSRFKAKRFNISADSMVDINE